MEAGKVKRVLSIAADLIDKGFTKEAEARDKAGNSVTPLDPEACRFCALGAIQLATYLSVRTDPEMGDQSEIYCETIKAVRNRARESGAVPTPFFISYGFSSSLIHNWNDSPGVTGADVSALFRDTAAHVGKMEGEA